MADAQTHKDELEKRRSRTARLAYVLEYFFSIRKPSGKRGGGRPWPGLHLE